MLGVVAVITALQYLPALALGPIAEQLLASGGATF
jgi:K+-transporting ATPase A subunit